MKGTNPYPFSKGGSVLAQLNVAFFTTMHPSAAKRKLLFIKVPVQAAKLCALDPATGVNPNTHGQRYKATFSEQQQPTAYQKLVFCFY